MLSRETLLPSHAFFDVHYAEAELLIIQLERASDVILFEFRDRSGMSRPIPRRRPGGGNVAADDAGAEYG